MQIAADLMRMRWDERIPEDFAQALCDKGVRLRDVVYAARRNAEIVSGRVDVGGFPRRPSGGPAAFIADEPPQAGIRKVGGSTELGRAVGPPACSAG